MTDKPPFLQAATDPGARASRRDWGFVHNIETIHSRLDEIGIDPCHGEFSESSRAELRISKLVRQYALIKDIIGGTDDENE